MCEISFDVIKMHGWIKHDAPKTLDWIPSESLAGFMALGQWLISVNLTFPYLWKVIMATYVCLSIKNLYHVLGPPSRHRRKESACWCRCESNPWIRKIPWSRKWQPTPVLLPGESHGQRSLVGYSPWGCKESDTTEYTHAHTQQYGWSLPPIKRSLEKQGRGRQLSCEANDGSQSLYKTRTEKTFQNPRTLWSS